MKRYLSVLAAAATAVSAPASAQDATTFTPDSVWAADYGDDYCRLTRDFSNGTDTISLIFERVRPGAMFRLFVVGDSVSTFRGADMVGYRLLPSGAPRMSQRLRLRAGGGQEFMLFGPIMLADMPGPGAGAPPGPPPPYSPEAEKTAAGNVEGILFSEGFTTPIRVETGDLEAPFAALQACADDLLNVWGLDVEAHKSLSRPVFPDGPTAGWIESTTVPFSEFASLSGGRNEYRVMVDKTGEATSCHVHSASLSESMNNTVCELILENGSFMPALDSSGEPVDSYWFTSVFFLTPPFGG